MEQSRAFLYLVTLNFDSIFVFTVWVKSFCKKRLGVHCIIHSNSRHHFLDLTLANAMTSRILAAHRDHFSLSQLRVLFAFLDIFLSIFLFILLSVLLPVSLTRSCTQKISALLKHHVGSYF